MKEKIVIKYEANKESIDKICLFAFENMKEYSDLAISVFFRRQIALVIGLLLSTFYCSPMFLLNLYMFIMVFLNMGDPIFIHHSASARSLEALFNISKEPQCPVNIEVSEEKWAFKFPRLTFECDWDLIYYFQIHKDGIYILPHDVGCGMHYISKAWFKDDDDYERRSKAILALWVERCKLKKPRHHFAKTAWVSNCWKIYKLIVTFIWCYYALTEMSPFAS